MSHRNGLRTVPIPDRVTFMETPQQLTTDECPECDDTDWHRARNVRVRNVGIVDVFTCGQCGFVGWDVDA